jgi:hypothetical protein
MGGSEALDPCDLWLPCNISIAFTYGVVGCVMSLILTPLNVYQVHTLDAEPVVQTTLVILQQLPWSLKLLFGFLSDLVPVGGMHRKPYLLSGAALYSSIFVAYGLSEQDSLPLLALTVFVGTLGIIQMDVMADTMVVERSKFEAEERKGQLQATCYSIRFGASFAGALVGSSVCNQKQWNGWGLNFHQVCLLCGSLPLLLVLPTIGQLKEKFSCNSTGSNGGGKSMTSGEGQPLLKDPESRMPHPNYSDSNSADLQSAQISDAGAQLKTQSTGISVAQQLQEIWKTVQLRAVWRPMSFVYIFNILQVPNVAWQSYLQLGLDFPPWILGMTVTIGSLMTCAGILVYKHYLFNMSWRAIYVWSTVLCAVFSMMQLLLIFQVNQRLGIANYWFSMGDDVINAYISGIQFLPVCIMYMRLCPEGAEGASYSMLTTFGNIALVCANNVGAILSGLWDVSNYAMRAHDYSGLWKLTVFTSIISTVPLSLLWLLPRNAEEQDKLGRSKERSKIGGGIFLVVLLASLLWTTYQALVDIRAGMAHIVQATVDTKP